MTLDRIGAGIEAYLGYLSNRQSTIASNIANADTPGYLTRDVVRPASFADILTQSLATPAEVAGLKMRNDGNNVDLDRESRLLTENTMRFSLASQMLKGQIRQIKMAIEDGK